VFSGAPRDTLAGHLDSKILIAIHLGLLLSGRSLLLLTIHVHSIVVLLRRVGDLGHDLAEEVEAVGLGDGLLEVDGGDAFRVARLGFGGGFGDEGDHEEFERFRWEVLVYSLLDSRRRKTYKQQQA
jgi:hypothetical protein